MLKRKIISMIALIALVFNIFIGNVLAIQNTNNNDTQAQEINSKLVDNTSVDSKFTEKQDNSMDEEIVLENEENLGNNSEENSDKGKKEENSQQEVDQNSKENMAIIQKEVTQNTEEETTITQQEVNDDKLKKDEDTINTQQEITKESNKTAIPTISYQSHIQNIGWQGLVNNGTTSGTSGESLRIEAVKLNIQNLDSNVSLKYQVHIQNIGWQSWKSNGEMAGTTGKALRVEAIKIRLESTEDYSVMYRVHIQDIGWQDWKSDGDIAGTEGKKLRIEAIQVKIVSKINKGKITIESPASGTSIYERNTVSVSGWKMSNLKNTYIKATLDNNEINENEILYLKRSDIIDTISGYGTSIENPTPGFKFSIDTNNLTMGEHIIKVCLYTTDGELLNSKSTKFNVDDNLHVLYSSHVQDIGWQSDVTEDFISGTEGRALRIEALKINLLNRKNNEKIQYRAHIQNIGWQDWKTNGQTSGTEGKSLRMEAVQIKLENMDEYTVEYQVHIQDIGWSGWYIDGETAGTVGKSKRIEAIRIRLVPKYKRNYIGIDVSQYNGTIDWKSVKNSGIDFAMIRVGFRGWGQAGNFKEDSNFRANLESAKAAGLKVGVYFVTQAITEQEAIEEANWVLDKIRNYKMDYPVAIDIEQSTASNGSGRADHLDKNTRTILAKRFCEVIQNAGYTPIVYLNVNWAKNYVDMSQLTAYDTWIANYKHDSSLKPSYTGSYTIWQYTDAGSVGGVSGNVDVNICYKKYS